MATMREAFEALKKARPDVYCTLEVELSHFGRIDDFPQSPDKILIQTYTEKEKFVSFPSFDAVVQHYLEKETEPIDDKDLEGI